MRERWAVAEAYGVIWDLWRSEEGNTQNPLLDQVEAASPAIDLDSIRRDSDSRRRASKSGGLKRKSSDRLEDSGVEPPPIEFLPPFQAIWGGRLANLYIFSPFGDTGPLVASFVDGNIAKIKISRARLGASTDGSAPGTPYSEPTAPGGGLRRSLHGSATSPSPLSPPQPSATPPVNVKKIKIKLSGTTIG